MSSQQQTKIKVRFAGLLQDEGQVLYSIEPDTLGHACTTAFLHRAGLTNKDKVYINVNEVKNTCFILIDN